jgi:Ca2+-binding RTX toxin-like protein
MSDINGTESGDTLDGTADDDTINGLGGDDTINGGGGNDTLNGGEGNDTLDGNSGHATLNGQAGNDTLKVSQIGFYNLALGGTGSDTLVVDFSAATTNFETRSGSSSNRPTVSADGGYSGAFTDSGSTVEFDSIESFNITTGSGNDFIATGSGPGTDTVSLGAGDDYADVRAGNMIADGGTGTDAISGDLSLATTAILWDLTGATPYSGPAGTSIVNFEWVGEFRFGAGFRTGSGNDVIVTTSLALNDEFVLGAGDDTITVVNGGDYVDGNAGFDTLIVDYSAATTDVGTSSGSSSNRPTFNGAFGGYDGSYGTTGRGVGFSSIDRFIITTGSGNDVIFGAGGNDEIRTGAGNDYLEGNGGNDILDGGAGNDTADGGAGDDTIIVTDGYDSVYAGAGVDTLVVDYSSETAAVETLGLQTNNTSDGGFNGNYANPTSTRRVDFSSVDKFVITTGSGNDSIKTGSGYDIVNLGAGDDLVDLGAGTYSADGGDGVDGVSANLAAIGSGVTIDLTAATTTSASGTLANFEYIGTLTTTAFDDVVVTRDIARDETINTGAGADRVTVRNGYDIVSAGAGVDTLVVDYSSETAAVTTLNFATSFTAEGGFNGNYATGTNSRRVDFFNADNFVITTGSGDDNIKTGSGNDVVNLGAGDDVVDLGSGSDSADGGDGVDGVSANLSAFGAGVNIDLTAASTPGGAGTLANFEYIGTLTTTAFDDVVVTRDIARNETINTGAGADRVTVRNGYDTVSAGAGVDTLVVDYSSETAAVTTLNFATSFTAEGGFNGNYATGTNSRRVDFFNVDKFVITTGSGDDVITTGSGADLIRTGAGADTVNAGDGNDVIDGEAGSDTMNGGAGDDALYAVSGRSAIERDIANGGAGTDSLTVDFSGSASRIVMGVPLTANGGGGHDGNFRNVPNVQSVTFSSIERFNVTGSAFNDSFTTGSGNDLILLHNGGDDTVSTGAGNDSIYFGAAYTAADVVDGGTGTDTLILQGTYSLTLGTASLSGIEAMVLLAYTDNRFGGATAGPNTYDFTVPNGFSGGQPFVLDARSLGASETVRFDGSAETVAAFTLTGGAGNDELIGGGGNDHLDGAAGNDILRGGGGNDRYYVETGDSVAELVGGGNDIVYARSSFALSAGAEVELLAAISGTATDAIDLTGNEFNNTIQGNAGANQLVGGGGNDYLTGLGGDDGLFGGDGDDLLFGGIGNDVLDGGAGRDRLTGGTGNDNYYVDAADSVVEAAGEGTDGVFARTSYALAAGASIELLATADANATTRIDLTGNELANTIQGNAGDNYLRGGGGDDSLQGFAGNDTLDGGTGVDVLDGGAGNDRYLVDAGDTIVEGAGGGTDNVYARTSFVLNAGAQVELLAAIDGGSTDPIALTGNELNNTIQGNAGANTLLGGGGIDYLSGLDGDDVLDGGAGRDILVGGSGADTFRFSDVAHSPLYSPDRIADFVSGTDKIDLSLIDADSAAPGDQAFAFIGTQAFTHTAGELRYDVQANGVNIYGDVNGDGIADLHILVSGLTSIGSADFIF